jgi:hypothetical protein
MANVTLPLFVVPKISACGTERVPVKVPPLARVIVKLAFTGSETIAVVGTDAATVPFPIPFVKFAWPVIPKPAAVIVVVAFTVKVVLIVAARAAVHISSAKAKFEKVRFIGLLESSTLETQNLGENWPM